MIYTLYLDPEQRRALRLGAMLLTKELKKAKKNAGALGADTESFDVQLALLEGALEDTVHRPGLVHDLADWARVAKPEPTAKDPAQAELLEEATPEETPPWEVEESNAGAYRVIHSGTGVAEIYLTEKAAIARAAELNDGWRSAIINLEERRKKEAEVLEERVEHAAEDELMVLSTEEQLAQAPEGALYQAVADEADYPVACPRDFCNAPVGECCKSSGGNPTLTHIPRVDRAEKEGKTIRRDYPGVPPRKDVPDAAGSAANRDSADTDPLRTWVATRCSEQLIDGAVPPELRTALLGVSDWLGYKRMAKDFGVRARRVDFEVLEDLFAQRGRDLRAPAAELAAPEQQPASSTLEELNRNVEREPAPEPAASARAFTPPPPDPSDYTIRGPHAFYLRGAIGAPDQCIVIDRLNDSVRCGPFPVDMAIEHIIRLEKQAATPVVDADSSGNGVPDEEPEEHRVLSAARKEASRRYPEDTEELAHGHAYFFDGAGRAVGGQPRPIALDRRDRAVQEGYDFATELLAEQQAEAEAERHQEEALNADVEIPEEIASHERAVAVMKATPTLGGSVQEVQQINALLWHALHTYYGAAERWAGRREQGLSDQQLATAITTELGQEGRGRDVPPFGAWRMERAMAGLALVVAPAGQMLEQRMRGDRLRNWTRVLLEIPQPAPELAEV